MIIDTNVYLSRWPTRRLPADETPQLVEKLKRKTVTQAWVGSFDALLHKDVAAVNIRLHAECLQHADLLIPFGCVNPALPDWQEDLRRCHEVHQMPGIRLHPNYHGYTLADPRVAELLQQAETRGLLVQIALRMEDPRTQHVLLQVADVDAAPLAELLPRFPQLKVQLLNALTSLSPAVRGPLLNRTQVTFETAMLEGLGGIGNALQQVPLNRLCFGSYFPFFAWESASLKLRESELAAPQITAIQSGNALAWKG